MVLPDSYVGKYKMIYRAFGHPRTESGPIKISNSSGLIRHIQKPIWTSRGQLEPVGASRGQSGPVRASKGQSEPVRASQVKSVPVCAT